MGLTSQPRLIELMKPADFPAFETFVPSLEVASTFDALLQYPPVKALAPLPVLLLLAPLIWFIFRDTWRDIDEEARSFAREHNEIDYRPIVCLILLGVTLTLQDYYGGKVFFRSTLQPMLQYFEGEGHEWIQFKKYRNLYSYAWWSASRIGGYVIGPLIVWRVLFPRDSVLDMGLRVKGFVSHLWIYGLCLVVVVGAMALLSQQKDFLAYYPFYKESSRSWFDLLVWETMYFAQFFALEFFFRGWILAALRRTMGASAIFVMAVPYCMIHYGKPYLEAHGAIVAGVVLGSLAMRTRSIYAGFLLHITVAGLMDYFALASRGGLPTQLWPD